MRSFLAQARLYTTTISNAHSAGKVTTRFISHRSHFIWLISTLVIGYPMMEWLVNYYNGWSWNGLVCSTPINWSNLSDFLPHPSGGTPSCPSFVVFCNLAMISGWIDYITKCIPLLVHTTPTMILLLGPFVVANSLPSGCRVSVASCQTCSGGWGHYVTL